MRHEGHGPMPDVRDCRKRRGRDRDRCYFELMGIATFKAGLNYSVIEAKWDAIREAFHGFDPRAVAAMTGSEIRRLESDPRVIRSARKIEGVVRNAHRMLEIEAEHGGFAEWLDTMPDAETRIAALHREFAFMGPSTAYYFLHYAGEAVPDWHEWAAAHPEVMGRSRAGATRHG